MECLKQLLNHRVDGDTFWCNLRVKIVMEHLCYFAFLDLESLQISEKF